MSIQKKILLCAAVLLMAAMAPTTKAQSVGDNVNFNVDQNYDAMGSSAAVATLIKSTSSLYFYVQKDWWDSQTLYKKNQILNELDALSVEFSNTIYPTLTSVYGSEAKPGVDGDPKITILFQSIKDGLGGYFRSADEYSKLQSPDSNQREMLYMPIAQIDSPQLKVFLAHEFTHVIVFNQKDKLQGVQEEVWLSEARSDYASTLLGYDDTYEGSNVQRRVEDFLDQPGDSLTEWQGTKYDYAVESVFMHYLVDHYGINILTDSLHSKLVGIPSLNEALVKNGAKEDFAQIFTNWTISVIINNCLLDAKYCYVNKNLAGLKINSMLNFLPLAGNSSLSVTNVIKNWAGSWQKIIGGNGNLHLEFSSLTGLNFRVPYIIYAKDGSYTVNFLKLDANEKGKIDISNFGTQYNSLIIIPSLQTKISGLNGSEVAYPYTFTVSITSAGPSEDPAVIQKLLARIDSLKKQIAALEAKQNGQVANAGACQLYVNLYMGVVNKDSVICLQQFLKSQGVSIYPEAFVTGTFGNLTKLAVTRFQKMYGIFQTGYVGLLTRKKINQLLLP